MNVQVTTSLESYGDEISSKIFNREGDKELVGFDFGDIETGSTSDIVWYYFRHNGDSPIYNCSLYLRALGLEWGGYVEDAEDSRIPYNPNFFRNGGLDDEGHPKTSTDDYNLMRELAYNNPEMGVRLYFDREDDSAITNGLGYDNQGLSFSALEIPSTALDYSSSSNEEKNGYIYPAPEDQSKIASDGDEAKVGISVQLPDDLEDSGHIQFSLTFKYRYTT